MTGQVKVQEFSFSRDIGDKKFSMVLLGFILTVIASSLLVVLLGPLALSIPATLILIYLLFGPQRSLPSFFFVLAPLATLAAGSNAGKINIKFAWVILLIWSARKLLMSDIGISVSPILIKFFLFFLMAAVVSLLNDGMHYYEGMIFIRLLIFISLIMVVYDCLELKYTVWLYFFATLPIILISAALLREYLQTSGLLAMLALYRAKGGGFIYHVNVLGYIDVVLLSFWTAIAIWGRNAKMQIIGGFLSFLLVFALLLTGARASILGFVVTICLYAYWAGKIKYLVIFFILVAVIISIPPMKDLIGIVFRADASTSGRDVIWLNSLDMIKRNPVFGIGINNYFSEYMRYVTSKSWHYEIIPPSAHNQILDYWVEMGILGLVVVFLLYYFPVKYGRRALKKARTNIDRSVLYGLLGGIAAFFFRSLWEGGAILLRGIPYPAIFYWLALMIFLKYSLTEVKESVGVFKPF